MKTITKKLIKLTLALAFILICIGTVSAATADENITISDTPVLETEETLQEVSISGKVEKCSDGNPFPGVTVTTTSSGETISTTTNTAGTYSLKFKSSSTNFQVTASAPGHQPSTQEVTVLPGEDNNYQQTANFKLGMDTVYVATTGSDATGDGTDANPYRTIAKGITEANPDGTVNVADGTYQEHLILDKNVNLVGTSQTGTIIDGTSNGRPVTIHGGVTATMSFFTIQNGRVTGSEAYGGGIYNNGNLTLNNCTVKANQANPTTFYGSSYGGGIYNAGIMTIKGSTVEYNYATGYYAYGGGINNWGTMTIEDSTVQYNNAMSSSDEALGGGIYNEDTLTIINSNIRGNTAWSTYPDDAYGGGIYNYGTLIMDNTNMEGNIARGYYAVGGGIYNFYGNMEISNSNINKNEAQASGSSCYGGGIYLNGGSLTLTNSNINQNTVTGPSGYSAEGGGIYNSGANMNITGGSVSSNRVNGGDAKGGGISISWGYHNTVAINGCTIQDNAIYSTSTSNGGGIYYHAGPGYNTATMAITDSTIKGNTATNGGGIYNAQSTMTITGSTIQENNAIVGAGIWSSGTTTISDSTITGNIASIQGGGIDHRGGTLTVTETDITHNTATSYGGGISNDGTLNIQNSAINDNTAMFGGGIYNIDREVVLDNTELLRNTATGGGVNGARGGAIFNYNGAVTIDNSMINDNTANALSTDSYGGGIYTRGGSLTVTNSNINHNTATAVSNVYGGGIYTYDTTVTMNFNRIVGNSPKAIYHSLDSQYGTVNAEYNWWGSNYDAITSYFGSVDIWPWLYMTFQADPTTIQQGDTSTLTANFNNAWDGENPVTPFDPVIGHLPDGTLVTFTTDLGQVGSQTVDKPTVNGVATATLTGTESGLANLSATLDDETLTLNVEVENDPCANVTITKTGNGPLNVGDTGTFTVSLHNNGPDAAHNVAVTDIDVPTGWTVTPSVGSWDSNTNTWNVGTLNNGADATLTISGLINTAMAGTTITNTVTETQDEMNQETQTATASITVNPVTSKADLYINSWSSKNNPTVGEIYTITFKLGNRGPDTAENVVFTLPLPDGVEFVDVNVDQGTTSYDPATRTITWTLGDVVVGDPYAWVRVRAMNGGSFIFRPILTTDTYDPNIESNIQALNVNVQAAGGSSETVHAQTVGMQKTGTPLIGMVLAVLMVLGGLISTKRH